MPTITTNCKGCQKEFTTYRSPAYLEKYKELYCSKACFDVHWAKAELFVCDNCGKDFTARRTPDRPNPRYCSMKCHTKHVGSMVDFVCQTCGKVFETQRSHKRKYCSKSCSGKHSYVVGRNPSPIFGDCKQCKKQLNKAQHEDGGLFCSKQCFYSFRTGLSTEKYNAIINGLLPNDLPTSYRGPNWAKQRNNARHRDKYCCQRCGITESALCRQLDVHHIQPFRTFALADYKAANALANLVSLCHACHLYIEWSVAD